MSVPVACVAIEAPAEVVVGCAIDVTYVALSVLVFWYVFTAGVGSVVFVVATPLLVDTKELLPAVAVDAGMETVAVSVVIADVAAVRGTGFP